MELYILQIFYIMELYILQIFNNGTLHFTNVYMEDKGRYGCTANNSAGHIRMEANLNVASKLFL